jgi:putative ABC transport system permease protein
VLSQDIRYAFRSLLKSRGFTTVAVACLALGIGVNTTIFSMVDGIMLKPYPYADADRIVVINSTNARRGIRRGSVSYADFKDLRDRASTLVSAAAFTGRSLTVSDGSTDPERYLGTTVSWQLFDLLGTPPVHGRNFGPQDDRPGAEPVVLLSDHVWTRRYNRDLSVVGRAVSLNGRPHTIIGVMPPKFAFPENSRLWVPLAPYAEPQARDDRNLQVFAKMKPGVTIEQTRADMTGVADRLAAEYPVVNENWSAAVRPLSGWMLPEQVKLTILSMMAAATLVLVVACANVANLLLARASVRQREISLRAALGAGRWRIVRQLLTEAVLIGTLSAPLGFAIAWIGLALIDRGIPPDQIPYFIQWSLDFRSLGYTIATAMLTGIVFGLAPAVQAARVNLQETLKEGGRGSAGGSRAWLRSTFVVTEVALSLVLLVGAALFVRSFLNLQHAQVGFETAPLMTMRFYLPGEAYESPDAKSRRVEDIVRRIESLPAVQAAFASNFVPLGGGGGGGSVLVEGRPVPAGEEPEVGFTAVSPRLRQTLDVALMRGRDFTQAEGTTRTPVALINQAMAKKVWGDEDPVGRRFRLKGDRIADWFTVIGIVADFRHFQRDSDEEAFPAAYVPYPFDAALNTGLTIRVAGEPASVTAAVREQIRESDPSLPVFQVRTMEEVRQLSFWQFRLFGWIFGIFGFVALVLASIGVYGVLSYSVSQRTQEIGVRVALGAARADVLRLVVSQGLKLAAIGIVLGLGAAFGVTRFIRTLLYNVTPTDPVSFATVSVFLMAIAFLASYVPARRATGVDPIVALRGE